LQQFNLHDHEGHHIRDDHIDPNPTNHTVACFIQQLGKNFMPWGGSADYSSRGTYHKHDSSQHHAIFRDSHSSKKV
jgi:hypothetical protein